MCKESCYAANINNTQDNLFHITKENVDQAIDKKLNDYASRHIRCLESFIELKVLMKYLFTFHIILSKYY